MSVTYSHLPSWITKSGLGMYPVLCHIPRPMMTHGLEGEAWDIYVFPSKIELDGSNPLGNNTQIGWLRRVGNIAQHISVDKRFRHDGIGMHLLELALDQCPELYPDTDVERDGEKLLRAAAKKFNRPDWLDVVDNKLSM